jgi:uncharacterized protein
MKRYLVMTLRTAQFDPGVIAPHYAHLDALRAQGRLDLAGPFTDKSGGAYVVRAEDPGQARGIAFSDPVHTSGSSQVTVYEWNA